MNDRVRELIALAYRAEDVQYGIGFIANHESDAARELDRRHFRGEIGAAEYFAEVRKLAGGRP